MCAAHGGFGSERVPLGGGAAVFERLCAHWRDREEFDLFTVGAGPTGPEGVHYQQLAPPSRGPSELGVLAYARFCTRFQEQTTAMALDLKPDLVLAHDVSEGPDVHRLTAAGIAVATIFHVDVVDIFRRLYLGSLPSAQFLTNFYRRWRGLPWPRVLGLVFEKQQAVMEAGALSIAPSSGATKLLRECYPNTSGPVETVGWGAPTLPFGPQQIQAQASSLRARYGIGPDDKVLLTLSRLSPEKAQHRLLEAIELAQHRGEVGENLWVVIAGAPAFMQGQRHARRLHRMAERLRVPVIFPGHVGGLVKAAWYRAADLFVVNSLHESYGLTTLEAMQQGCPVVAVESFGTIDTVVPEVGSLVKPGPDLHQRLWGEIQRHLEPKRQAEASKAALERSRELSFSNAAGRVADLVLAT